MGIGEESRVISLRKRRIKKKYGMFFGFFTSFVDFFKIKKNAVVRNNIKKPVNH